MNALPNRQLAKTTSKTTIEKIPLKQNIETMKTNDIA